MCNCSVRRETEHHPAAHAHRNETLSGVRFSMATAGSGTSQHFVTSVLFLNYNYESCVLGGIRD
jgi:hypothetical protein